MVGEEHKEFNTKTVEFVDIKHLILKLEFPVIWIMVLVLR